MPVYEYRCNGCKHEFEISQRMSDPDLVKCEQCGENKLEKLISWVGFGGGMPDSALYSPNPREHITVDRSGSRPPKKEPAPAPAPVAVEAPTPTVQNAEDEEDDDSETP